MQHPQSSASRVGCLLQMLTCCLVITPGDLSMCFTVLVQVARWWHLEQRGLTSHSLPISWLQERPIRAEQLLSEGSTAHRLTNLAAVSDSLDYLAEAIVQFGKHAVSRLQFVCCK